MRNLIIINYTGWTIFEDEDKNPWKFDELLSF